jgi:hypothetical protein
MNYYVVMDIVVNTLKLQFFIYLSIRSLFNDAVSSSLDTQRHCLKCNVQCIGKILQGSDHGFS